MTSVALFVGVSLIRKDIELQQITPSGIQGFGMAQKAVGQKSMTEFKETER
ncbi:MAG: hypothetical protein JXR38_01290 [Bacilli bacterium]|nr:hypothetical protein [Bacilli bacterium]